MGFGSTKNQLSKLILPRNWKQSDATASTVGCEYDDDCSKSEHPLPLVSTGRQTSGQDGPAYNFDLFNTEVDGVKDEITPIAPSPYIAETCIDHPFRSTPSPKVSPKASYRWYLGESGKPKLKKKEEAVEDLLKPFFTFGIHSGDDDDNLDFSLTASLLHGGSSKSLFAKPTTPSSSCLSPHNTYRKNNNVDERAYLMYETAISNDWSERQLAFDLDVVEDDPSSDDSPLQILPSSGLTFEPPNIFFDDSLYLMPPPYSSPSSESIKVVDPKQQQNLYESLVCDIRSSRKSIQYYNQKSLTHRHRRGVRKSARRRGSPVLRGSKFLPNLSTVTERPSEDDASCYMPTPRNNHCAQRFEFSISVGLSEEDTVETCSSKGSL